MKKIFASIFISFLVLAPATFAYAANPFTQATKNLDTSVGGLSLPKTVEGTVGTVIKGVLGLVGTIFFGLTIYAGILWMTASGNEEQVEKSKSIIQAAIIGLFITMSAYAITTFVASRIGTTTGTGTQETAAPSCSGAGGVCAAGSADCTGTQNLTPGPFNDCTDPKPNCCK